MESIEAEDIRHTNWDHLLFSKKQTRTSDKTGWDLFVLAAVVFLHAGVIAGWFQWQELERPGMNVVQDTLEITFIERTVALEPEAAPSASGTKTVTMKRIMPLSGNATDAPVPAESGQQVSSASLRLTIDNDEWNSPSVIPERNPLKRQYIALAGRSEPFVQGIKFRNKLTPQQKLAMVGKLFGAVEHDPCAEARRRLASGQSQLHEIDLDADLRAIENYCRP